MDEKFIESGQETQEAVKAAGLARVSRLAMPDAVLPPHEYVRYDCRECEDDLPTFRMQKGFTLCTACQSALEVERKRRAA